MDNQALQKIRDTISRAQAVSLAVSKNPTVDQMAAALSLYLTLEMQGKKVTIVSPTEPIVELSSLVGIDKVKTSNEGTGGDLVVSFPYREGEIEKVSYTIDGGTLNIVVKAGEAGLTFSEQDVIFKRGSDKPELLMTVGVQRLSDVEALFPEDALKDVTIINIDNSASNEGFGGMVLVSAKFSSLSEQVADLMLNLGYELDVDVAQNLLSGVTQATSNFQSPTTSYLAFEIAAILMKRGAVRAQSQAVAPRSNQPAPQSQPAFRPQPQRQPQQQQSQRQQPPRNDDRNDRRQAIRDALKAQSQARQDRHPEPQPAMEEPVQAEVTNDVQEAQPQSQPQRQPSDQKPPSDWLTPKVYKGSSNV